MVKASSAADRRLSARPRTATALQARTNPNASASDRETDPRGIGRPAVRLISASMSASYHMLSTPAEPPPTAIARIAISPRNGSGRAGAISSPTSAVKTASDITRGFINATNAGSRAAKLGREANQGGDKVIAVVFMVDSSTEVALAKVTCLVFATVAVASQELSRRPQRRE